MRIFFSILVCLLLLCSRGYAQEDPENYRDDESDTTYYDEYDTLYDEADSVNYEARYKDIKYWAPPDSSLIEKKAFNKQRFDELKSDPDLNFEQAPTIAGSLWDRFWAWIAEILASLFDNAVNTNWGRLLVYVIGVALLVVLIMMMLKVDAFKVLYSGQGQTQKYQVLDENIHEMDFEKLIREAMDQKDYRRGVRLVFLYALKLLSDKDLIHFESGKTNHDYVAELKERDLKTGFSELSFYFDYAWYGNFNITRDTFRKVEQTFQDWKSKVNT